MRHEVRVSDADIVDDLLADLRRARVSAQRKGPKTLVVTSAANGDDLSVELSFFLQAWALARPGVRIDLVETR